MAFVSSSDNDVYKTLRNTLERRLKKEREVPAPSCEAARRIEEAADPPPSELELFFKVSRRRP